MNRNEWETKEMKAKAYLENKLETEARRQGTPKPVVVELIWQNETVVNGHAEFGFGVHVEGNYFPKVYRVTAYPKFYRISEC